MNQVLKQDIDMIIQGDILWEKLKGKTVLITGASGMIGSYMLYTLTTLNDELNYGIKIIAMLRNPNKLPAEVRERLKSKVQLIILSMQQARQAR